MRNLLQLNGFIFKNTLGFKLTVLLIHFLCKTATLKKTNYRLMQVQGEHYAILSTFIKLPFANKIFILSIFEWPFYTGFTVPIVQWTLGIPMDVQADHYIFPLFLA